LVSLVTYVLLTPLLRRLSESLRVGAD